MVNVTIYSIHGSYGIWMGDGIASVWINKFRGSNPQAPRSFGTMFDALHAACIEDFEDVWKSNMVWHMCSCIGRIIYFRRPNSSISESLSNKYDCIGWMFLGFLQPHLHGIQRMIRTEVVRFGRAGCQCRRWEDISLALGPSWTPRETHSRKDGWNCFTSDWNWGHQLHSHSILFWTRFHLETRQIHPSNPWDALDSSFFGEVHGVLWKTNKIVNTKVSCGIRTYARPLYPGFHGSRQAMWCKIWAGALDAGVM